jgi:riboflavin synthase
MFSGIVEKTGEVKNIASCGSGLTFTLVNPFEENLHPDQSIMHNGVCLTVETIDQDRLYTVTAVEETLKKTCLGLLQIGDKVNLERSLTLNKFIDGHLVQGHTDTVGVCTSIEDRDGSWLYTFNFDSSFKNLMVEKGSITINGVSLTAFNILDTQFQVTIIPYTYQHTTFKDMHVGYKVNLEFDIVGKYVAKILANKQ